MIASIMVTFSVVFIVSEMVL